MRSSDAKRLIVINTIRTIIEIFLGPFLTAYFFKLNSNNVTIISVYYIFSYLVIALLSFIVGIVLKKHYELPVFKLGIMAKFIQLLILVFLGDNVKKHIWILAIISGISTITWAFPFNLFSSSLVDNKEKKEFVVYRNIGANIVKVIVPVLFGALISTKSFEMTALIVLGLSFVQLLLSLKLTVKKEEKKKESKLNLYENYLLLKQDKNTNNLLKSLFFQGMTFEGSLETTITLLIIIAFNKDFSLGIITSIGSFLSILSAYFCKKIIKPETMKKILLISCIIPLISTLGILFITNKITIIKTML